MTSNMPVRPGPRRTEPPDVAVTWNPRDQIVQTCEIDRASRSRGNEVDFAVDRRKAGKIQNAAAGRLKRLFGAIASVGRQIGQAELTAVRDG